MGLFRWMGKDIARKAWRFCAENLSDGKSRVAIEHARGYVRDALNFPDSALPEDCAEVRLLCVLASMTEEQALQWYRLATVDYTGPLSPPDALLAAHAITAHAIAMTEEVYHKVAQLIESSAQSKSQSKITLAFEDWMAILLGVVSAVAETAARVVAFLPANAQGEAQRRIIESLLPHLIAGIPARVDELNRSGGPLRA